MHSISGLASLLMQLLLVKAASDCYMVNGDLATSDFQPCHSVASGSHSACCNLGKSSPDICLGSGLCQRTDSSSGNFLIYTVGCTDQTGKDAVCQQWCPKTVNMYSLNPCQDSTWCCNDQSETTCCNDSNRASFQFDLTSLGLSQSPESDKISTGDIVGSSVGAFLLGALIFSLLGIFFVLRRQKRQRPGVEPSPAPESGGRAELESSAAQPLYSQPVKLS